MADNSGINRRVDGQGSISSSGPPQVELQLEESSFDLLVQDRGDGRQEHLPSPRRSFVSRCNTLPLVLSLVL
jgi:hypothetical protein